MECGILGRGGGVGVGGWGAGGGIVLSSSPNVTISRLLCISRLRRSVALGNSQSFMSPLEMRAEFISDEADWLRAR